MLLVILGKRDCACRDLGYRWLVSLVGGCDLWIFGDVGIYMCLAGRGRGERLECSLDGLVDGWRDGCKAYWFLSTARLKSEVVESYH